MRSPVVWVCDPTVSVTSGSPSRESTPLTPGGRVVCTVSVPASIRQATSIRPWAVSSAVSAQVRPPPGRGAMRTAAYPGSTGDSPPMVRCIQSATAPRA